jgi:hypothetical protein
MSPNTSRRGRRLVGCRGREREEVALLVLTERLVLDREARVAVDGELLGLVAGKEARGKTNRIGTEAVPEAGVRKRHLELGSNGGLGADLTLGEAQLRPQRGVAEVGDRLVVARIADGEGLRVELGGELGARRGHVGQTDDGAVDAGAELQHALLGVGEVVGLLPDGEAKDVEADMAGIGDKGARREHRAGLGCGGGGQGHGGEKGQNATN